MQAALDANATPGADTISFAIPEPACSAAGVCAIQLASPLPPFTEAVIVDGTTQPRWGTAPENVCATASAPSYMRIEIAGPGSSDGLLSTPFGGAAGGPSGVAAGTGDAISVTGSGSIDYTPWVTSGCPAPEPGATAAGLVIAATLAAVAARRRDPCQRTRAFDVLPR